MHFQKKKKVFSFLQTDNIKITAIEFTVDPVLLLCLELRKL